MGIYSFRATDPRCPCPRDAMVQRVLQLMDFHIIKLTENISAQFRIFVDVVLAFKKEFRDKALDSFVTLWEVKINLWAV